MRDATVFIFVTTSLADILLSTPSQSLALMVVQNFPRRRTDFAIGVFASVIGWKLNGLESALPEPALL